VLSNEPVHHLEFAKELGPEEKRIKKDQKSVENLIRKAKNKSLRRLLEDWMEILPKSGETKPTKEPIAEEKRMSKDTHSVEELMKKQNGQILKCNLEEWMVGLLPPKVANKAS